MTVADILAEFYTASQRFWFVQEVRLIDQTEVTVTLHLRITPQLFV